MALWILAAMQYTDYFNSVGGYTVKQGVAFDGDASGVRQEFGALGTH